MYFSIYHTVSLNLHFFLLFLLSVETSLLVREYHWKNCEKVRSSICVFFLLSMVYKLCSNQSEFFEQHYLLNLHLLRKYIYKINEFYHRKFCSLLLSKSHEGSHRREYSVENRKKWGRAHIW